MVPELLLQHRRFHVTGTDAVDPYLVRCRFQGQGLGEGHDGAFRRPVESAGDVAWRPASLLTVTMLPGRRRKCGRA